MSSTEKGGHKDLEQPVLKEVPVLKHAYLQRHDAHQNLHRFYQLWVTPGLFGDWSLVREWGQVGSPGTVRKNWFETESDAEKAGLSILNAKVKKGYVLFQIVYVGQ